MEEPFGDGVRMRQKETETEIDRERKLWKGQKEIAVESEGEMRQKEIAIVSEGKREKKSGKISPLSFQFFSSNFPTKKT